LKDLKTEAVDMLIILAKNDILEKKWVSHV